MSRQVPGEVLNQRELGLLAGHGCVEGSTAQRAGRESVASMISQVYSDLRQDAVDPRLLSSSNLCPSPIWIRVQRRNPCCLPQTPELLAGRSMS